MATVWCWRKVDWPTGQTEDSDRNSCTYAAIDKVLLTKRPKMHIREKVDSSTNGVEKIVILHIKRLQLDHKFSSFLRSNFK